MFIFIKFILFTIITNQTMSQVVGSQKYHALEVVDSLKVDNELVFSDLTLDGNDLSIVCEGTFSLMSMATDTTAIDFVGIDMIAVEEVVISSSGKNASLLAGVDDTVNTNGVVVLGHRDADGNTIVAHVQAGWVGGVNTLGFYGTAPIARQTGVAVTAAGVHGALVALGLITA